MSEILTDAAALAKSHIQHCEAWKWVVKILGEEEAVRLAKRPEMDVPAQFIYLDIVPPVRGVG